MTSCGGSAAKLCARRRSSLTSTAMAAAAARAASHGWWLAYSISRSIASRAVSVGPALHYSWSGSRCRRNRGRMEYLVMRSNYRPIIAILMALLALPAARIDAAATAKTEAELRTLREKIDRITQQVSRDALERDRLSGSLKAAELSVGQARAELTRASRDYADRSARRTALAQSRQQQQQALVSERAALAGQLRVAYMIGREEPLKLLLNQQDPLHSERLFAYYGYFGRARADQIAKIQMHVQRLDELDTELAQQQTELATLKAAQQRQLQQ